MSSFRRGAPQLLLRGRRGRRSPHTYHYFGTARNSLRWARRRRVRVLGFSRVGFRRWMRSPGRIWGRTPSWRRRY